MHLVLVYLNILSREVARAEETVLVYLLVYLNILSRVGEG
jgi:hypothetical protein